MSRPPLQRFGRKLGGTPLLGDDAQRAPIRATNEVVEPSGANVLLLDVAARIA
jgi:hypothetical protein